VRFGKLKPVGEPKTREAAVPARVARAPAVEVRPWVHGRSAVAIVALAVMGCTPTSLDTVDLGDNPETAELSLDENFFHCEIQPKVITAQSCASGGAGEGSSCHGARSALRLVEVPAPSICQNGRLVGSATPESLVNLERVRSDVGVDADSSPLYRRPLGLDSHPRQVFAADSEAAMLLRSWLNGQATP
jgi:hypothetical protein